MAWKNYWSSGKILGADCFPLVLSGTKGLGTNEPQQRYLSRLVLQASYLPGCTHPVVEYFLLAICQEFLVNSGDSLGLRVPSLKCKPWITPALLMREDSKGSNERGLPHLSHVDGVLCDCILGKQVQEYAQSKV